MWWFLVGLLVTFAAIVDAAGMAPPGMVLIGLLITAFGGYRIYRKHFAKF